MVSFKITHFNLCRLRFLHSHYIIHGSTGHSILLHEFAADFTAIFDKLIHKQHKTYTLKFSSLQALAFLQLWVDYPLPVEAAVFINEIIATIDKKSKQPKY